MNVHTADRRGNLRVAAAHPAIVKDMHGRVIARGRVANASDNGVFIITRSKRSFKDLDQFLVELTLPRVSKSNARPDATRTVEYICRLVRTQRLGYLVGLGVEFIKKVS